MSCAQCWHRTYPTAAAYISEGASIPAASAGTPDCTTQYIHACIHTYCTHTYIYQISYLRNLFYFLSLVSIYTEHRGSHLQSTSMQWMYVCMNVCMYVCDSPRLFEWCGVLLWKRTHRRTATKMTKYSKTTTVTTTVTHSNINIIEFVLKHSFQISTFILCMCVSITREWSSPCILWQATLSRGSEPNGRSALWVEAKLSVRVVALLC